MQTKRSFLRHLGGVVAACALLPLAACGSGAAGADAADGTGGAAGASAPADPRVLIVGGGASHDFERWFQAEDSATLAAAGARVRYTDEPSAVRALLDEVDVLYLSNNQPLPDPALRGEILGLPASGRGLIIGHAGAWYNWEDWPEYNRTLVGGGARGHRRFGEFTVEVIAPDHPVMRGVPASFALEDELYRFIPDQDGAGMTVLATAREAETGTVYPIVWTVASPSGRIVVNTLGHDGKAHQHPAYQRILQNSLRWASGHEVP